MRIIICCLFSLFLVFLALGCGESNSKNNSALLLLALSGDQLNASNDMYLNDSNGEVGRVVSSNAIGITMYSSTGYMYAITWEGILTNKVNSFGIPVNFSGLNCTGTAYYTPGGDAFYGKYIVTYGTKIYKPKTINANGTAYKSSVTTASNFYEDFGVCGNSSSTSSQAELVETTRSEVGIPATITPPLTITFK